MTIYYYRYLDNLLFFIDDEVLKRGKKYGVVVPSGKIVFFGQLGYEHYHDQIGNYSALNHFDKDRQKSYKKRHNYPKPKYSPGWFANKYLW
jgi:hypothetical protein